jgi:hypothetical protein
VILNLQSSYNIKHDPVFSNKFIFSSSCGVYVTSDLACHHLPILMQHARLAEEIGLNSSARGKQLRNVV